jgi:hypothetical protein
MDLALTTSSRFTTKNSNRAFLTHEVVRAMRNDSDWLTRIYSWKVIQPYCCLLRQETALFALQTDRKELKRSEHRAMRVQNTAALAALGRGCQSAGMRAVEMYVGGPDRIVAALQEKALETRLKRGTCRTQCEPPASYL